MNQRKEIWDAMLNAEMNAKYWKALVDRYSTREFWARIVIAFTASVTVAGWQFWSGIPAVWKCFSAVSAVLSLSLPIINIPKKVELMSNVRQQWLKQFEAYREQWSQYKSTGKKQKIFDAFVKTRKAEAKIEADETHLPEDKDLLNNCQKAVIQARCPQP